MDDVTDIPIFLVSNSDAERLKENTLANFKNLLPTHLRLKPTDYYIAVDEIVLDNFFDVPFCPKKDHLPSFIISTTPPPASGHFSKDDYSNAFKYFEKIFLPKRSFVDWGDFSSTIQRSQDSLFFDWTRRDARPIVPRIFSLLPFKEEDVGQPIVFGVFDQGTKKMKKWPQGNNYWLYVYAGLAEAIHEKDGEGGTKVVIDGCDYLAFKPNDTSGECFKGKSVIHLKSFYEPIVYVECKAAQGSHFNNTLKPYIFNFCLELNRNQVIDKPSSYLSFFIEPKTKSFHKISSEAFHSLQIRFCSRTGETLRLANGRATIAKLTLREIRSNPDMEDTFTVSVTSDPQEFHPDNKPNKFSSHFPSPIQFPAGAEYEVSLVSAVFPSRYDLKFSDRERVMIITFEDEEGNQSGIPVFINFPKSIHSLSEIVGRINTAIPYGEAKAFVNELGALVIQAVKFKMKFVVRKEFFHFLGAPMWNYESNAIGGDIIEIWRDKGEPYHFTFPPRFQFHLPSALWCYCSIIHPSILGSEYLPVLRIIRSVPKDFGISTTNISPVVHYAFDSLQFQAVSENTIRNITIEVRDHTGSLIPFSNNENAPTVINLMFRRKK